MTSDGRATAGESSTSGDLAFEDLVEEVTDRLEAGEPVDVEAYARRRPEHADRLRRLLPSLRGAHEMLESYDAKRLLPYLSVFAALIAIVGFYDLATYVGGKVPPRVLIRWDAMFAKMVEEDVALQVWSYFPEARHVDQLAQAVLRRADDFHSTEAGRLKVQATGPGASW